MAGENYTNTTGILINNKIIASTLKTIIQTLDQKLFDILTGVAAHSYLRLSNFSDLTISSGAVTLTSMSHTLISESGTSDDLDTINITPTGIQMIVLRATSGHTITVKHNTGNIKLASGTDLTLDANKRLVLFRDGSTFYDTLSSSTGGGGGGGVSSVGLSAPAILSVSGSPITSSGTLALALATQVKNKIWAGPSTGADAAPTFRDMVLDDLPSIATGRLLGNSSGVSAKPAEISIGSGLSLASNILSATGGGGSGDGGTSGNFITNGDFENWERGIAAAPDGWALVGTNAQIAQESTIVKNGYFSAKVTRVGNDCHFSYDAYYKAGYAGIRGRTLVFGAFVYATVASRARLRISDGVTTTYSSYHTGGSGWEWLTVSATMGGSVSALKVGLAVDTGNTIAYIDQATLAEGSNLTYPITPAINVNQVPKRATMWHDESLVVAGAAHQYTINASQIYNGFWQQSTAAINDAFTHAFYLAAGTYTFSVLGVTNTTRAQVDWYFDGVKLVSAQDWYAASATFNVVKTASVTIIGDGWHVLKGVAVSKNGSSSNYSMAFNKYWLAPAAD